MDTICKWKVRKYQQFLNMYIIILMHYKLMCINVKLWGYNI